MVFCFTEPVKLHISSKSLNILLTKPTHLEPFQSILKMLYKKNLKMRRNIRNLEIEANK